MAAIVVTSATMRAVARLQIKRFNVPSLERHWIDRTLHCRTQPMSDGYRRRWMARSDYF
jgi:hypothetical protein